MTETFFTLTVDYYYMARVPLNLTYNAQILSSIRPPIQKNHHKKFARNGVNTNGQNALKLFSSELTNKLECFLFQPSPIFASKAGTFALG